MTPLPSPSEYAHALASLSRQWRAYAALRFRRRGRTAEVDYRMDEAGARASWLGNRPIQVKLALAFGAMLLAFVAACAGIVFALDGQARTRAAQQATIQVIDAAQELRSAMHETEIAVYALLAETRSDGAEQLKVARQRLQQRLDELDRGDAAQDVQLHSLAVDISRRSRDWLATAVEPVLADLDAIGSDSQRSQRLHALTQHFDQLDRKNGDPLLALLGQIQVKAEAELHQRRGEADQATRTTEWAVLAMLALGVLVGAVALWLSARLIVQPIRDLTTLMTRLANHDHDVVVPQQQRQDEVGAIARALEVFKRTAIDTWWQNRNTTAIGEISAALQRCSDTQEFADTLCSELTPRLQAGIGLFFRYDSESAQLQRLGSYGYRERRHLETRYALGEGITGQCARESKTIVLAPVPDDYARIHSASGEAAPRSVIALPLLLQQRLLGVIEFASFAAFDERQQQLLDALLPLVALSWDNLSRALHTQLLLQRSQAQAQELIASEEALRVQREELRSANDALSAKTAQLEEQQLRLQASEEELRVQAEELQASNEELRQKGETLNEQKHVLEGLQRETEHKAQELARASQYKSDFLANMSHELRTPLNSMLILSRNLADNDDGRLAADQVESARVIYDAGSNLLRLINDILDLSKIEAGKMDVLIEAVPLQQLAHSLMRTYRPLAREKDLRFSLEIDDTLPLQMHSDLPKLEQILGNLIGNAIKFTREGEVSVNFAACPAELAQPLGLAADELVAMSVIDSGIGIPPHKLAAIFGVFEQVDASTARQFGGSGLGLSIARRLAQLLGGDVSADSSEGRGSRFTLVTPLRAQQRMITLDSPAVLPSALPAATVQPPANPRASTPATATIVENWIADDRDAIRADDTVILTIEDDRHFARVLVEQIRAKGFRALAAGDGESGLALAAQFRPNGILLDVLLPGMDGWAVLRRLQTNPATQGIPVHFISGVDESARGRESGAVGFLTKPAPREGLALAFERLLANDQGRQRHVLVIDDDEDSYLIVANQLAAPTVLVENAQTGRDGLDLLRERHFDCLVLDLQLPDMSGFEFLDEYARLDDTPPVVIHSARDLSSDESLRLRQFTDSIVIKGARSPQRLLDEVRLFLHSMRKDDRHYVARELDRGLSGRSVLVVDDDMRNIFALSKTLRARGLNVLMAQDGPKALRQLDDNPAIQLVLMDIMMPGMDGYETIREIRKRPALARLPVIAITAKAMRGDRDRCLEAGANDYLSKPLDIDKLLSMMRVWLPA